MSSLSEKLQNAKDVRVATTNPYPVEDEVIIRTVTGHVMPLIGKASLPQVTLNANQFEWPEFYVVKSFKVVDDYKLNPQSGFKLKNDPQDKEDHGTKTGTRHTQAKLLNGPGYMLNFNNPTMIESMATITVDFDSVVEDLVPEEKAIRLTGASVVLGMSSGNGFKMDTLKLKATGYVEYDGIE